MNGPQLRSWIEQLIHHKTKGEQREKYTYSVLCDLSYITGDSDTLWVFLAEPFGGSGIDVVHEQSVFSRNFCSQVLSH